MSVVDGLFKRLSDKGADETDVIALWNKSDTSGDGQLSASDFATFFSRLCSSYDVSDIDGAEAFKQLDANESGFVDYHAFMIHAIIGAEGTEDHSLDDQSKFAEWWKGLGRGSLTPTDSPWFDVDVEWAPPAKDGNGRFCFSPKNALAILNSQALIVKALVRQEPYVPPPNWKVVELLYAHPNGIKLSDVEDKANDKVLQGAIIEHPDAILVFIRGTIIKADVIADLKGMPASFDDFPGHIHRGFAGCYTRMPDLRAQWKASLRKLMESNAQEKPIIVAGHSLGGALAVMAFYDALRWYHDAGPRMLLMTYGCPRVGSSTFAKEFDSLVSATRSKAIRIANKADIITHLGPKLVYSHCGEEIGFELKLASNLKDWTKNHIDAYLEWLATEVGK